MDNKNHNMDKNRTFTTVEHSEYGKVLFFFDTQEYCKLPKEINDVDITLKELKSISREVFVMNGAKRPYYESFYSFMHSDDISAVIPVVCLNVEWNKRLTIMKVMLGDKHNGLTVFQHIEKIKSGWLDNNLMIKKYSKQQNIFPGKCYFIIVRKNEEAQNDMEIQALLQIKKGMK